jgi:hypothetical protein
LSASSGVAIGVQALSFTASGSSSGGASGWSSDAVCPDSLRQGIVAGLPVGVTLTTLDAASTTGVPADPQLTADDEASCAFSETESGKVFNEVVFYGMASGDADAIVAKVEADGFVGGGATPVGSGTQQLFIRGTSAIVIQRLLAGTTSVIVVIG